MPYVVDGNNVMAQSVGWHRDMAGARRRLIPDLVHFVAVHRVKLKVVFDGAPDEQFPDGSKYKGVQVLYARRGSDADSRIKELVATASYKRDLIVVSSDRELGSFVRSRGAHVIPSGRFRSLIEESCKLASSKERPGQAGRIDVEEWLEYFKKSGE